MTHRGIAYWVGGVAVVALLIGLFVAAQLSNRPRYPCNVPSLESRIPMTVTAVVPRSGYFVESCPAPIPQEMKFEREYGDIQMYWWGSPHRLYMVGSTATGRPLTFGGPRVEPFRVRAPATFLAGYTSRVTFAESSFADSDAAETFSIEIRDDGELREEITLRYVPRQCTCVSDPWGL
jgi:hypothetical protein